MKIPKFPDFSVSIAVAWALCLCGVSLSQAAQLPILDPTEGAEGGVHGGGGDGLTDAELDTYYPGRLWISLTRMDCLTLAAMRETYDVSEEPEIAQQFKELSIVCSGSIEDDPKRFDLYRLLRNIRERRSRAKQIFARHFYLAMKAANVACGPEISRGIANHKGTTDYEWIGLVAHSLMERCPDRQAPGKSSSLETSQR